MRADERDFEDYLDSLDAEGLKRVARSEHDRRVELEMRESSNDRVNTEVYIQYNALSEKYEALYKEHEELKTLYQHEVEKNVLKVRSTFGRKTEKLLDLINSANDKEDKFEDEDQSEDKDLPSGGRVITFPGLNAGDRNDAGKHTDNKGKSSKRSHKSRLKDSMKKLPHKIVYDIDMEQLDKAYGKGKWRIAFWHKHETIEAIPIRYYVKVVYTPVVSVGLEHSMHTIPYMAAIMPHSYVSSSLLAEIIYRKFVLGLPLYRLANDFLLSGLDLSKQDIIHWVNTITPELLDPVYYHLVSLLIHLKYVQSDETYIQVNKDGRGAGHKSFMWVHCSSELLDCPPIIVFCYEATRGTDHLRLLFGEFLGYMTCDAYISYQVLEEENAGVTVTGCFMHLRRYFAEAFFINDVALMMDEEIAELPETKVLMLIREVYAEENKLKRMSANMRLAARQEYVKPKVDALFSYIHELSVSDTVYTDRMNKAISYAINQEMRLRKFLNDGCVPLDNGHAERIIRSYSTGRVSWLFADTVPGALVNATAYSIVETAKANNVNVRIYLQYIIEKMSERIAGIKTLDTEFMDTMMPWSDEYQNYEENLLAGSLESFQKIFPEPEKPKVAKKAHNKAVTTSESPPSKTA